MAEIRTNANPPSGSQSAAKRKPGMPIVINMERPESKTAEVAAPAKFLAEKRLEEELNPKTPNPATPESGRLRYDREFLMQFTDLCTEKPDALMSIEEMIAENPPGGSKRASKKHKAKQLKALSAQTDEQGSTQSMGDIPPQIGNVQLQEGHPLRNYTDSNNNLLPPELEGGGNSGSHRENSRGKRQRKQDGGRGGGKGGRSFYQVGPPTIPMKQVVPLKVSETRWVPNRVAATPVRESGLIPIEVVRRKVKGLLNKLTLEKFDTISNQIIEFANQSVKETDGATLKVVAQSIFESATNDSRFAAIHALLARRIRDNVSVDIKDDNLKGPNVNITGANLFRKYLLNRCKEDFERWNVDLPKVNKNENDTVASGADPLLFEKYYVVAKVKHRCLGLIAFVGELFRLQMLTERIIHEYIKELLSNVADPVEEKTESLCKLMAIIGKDLDHKRAKSWMNVNFDRICDLLRSKKLSTRVKFMVQDVIDLRSRQWVPRRDMTQQLSPDSSHRGNGQHRGNPPVPSQDDGWSTVGSPTSSPKPNFGKMDRTKNSRGLNAKPQMPR